MKVLLTLFEIQDYGGIVGDVEFLMKGLREHGHKTKLVLLRNSTRDPYVRKMDGPKGSYPSVGGGQANTLAGWYGVDVIGYGGPTQMRFWQSYANEYDLVIHEIPGPKPEYEGWREIYDIKPIQIIAAHDAHFRDMYPHIREVAHRIRAITCTNNAGYNALAWCPIPRAFIGAAHQLLNWEELPAWSARPRAAACAHVWKAWKHMDKVVGAAPYLKSETNLWMAGDGIEGRYMRSKDKCKPKYEGLWQKALGCSNFEYFGLMSHGALFQEYFKSRVMVDMSFSKKFFELGNHFNRSVIEAYNTGMLPLCTNENMLEQSSQRPLFLKGMTHIGIPEHVDYEDIAASIDFCMGIPPSMVKDIIEYGRHKILSPYFDYRKTSLQYLDLAAGKPAGIYPNLELGRWPDGQ